MSVKNHNSSCITTVPAAGAIECHRIKENYGITRDLVHILNKVNYKRNREREGRGIAGREKDPEKDHNLEQFSEEKGERSMQTLVSSCMLDALPGLSLWHTLTWFGYSAPFCPLIVENTVKVVSNLHTVILYYYIHKSTCHQMCFCYSFKKIVPPTSKYITVTEISLTLNRNAFSLLLLPIFLICPLYSY